MKRLSRARLAALATVAVCAVSAAPAAASQGQVIVGGQNASSGEWPWAAHLNGTIYSCGGTLIAEKWVLTAAHCIALGAPTGPALPAAHISATVGRTDLNDRSSGRTIRALTAWIHPGWNPVTFENDIALLELSSAATGNPTIKIAGAGEEPLWAAGTSSTIVGWGLTKEGGDGSDILQEAQVPIVDDPTCAKYVDGYHAASMLCAGFIGKGGVDSCQGDSGGPLMVPAADNVWRQAGVVSWGIGCARPNDPGVYARVGAKGLRDFIASKVPSAIGSGATTSSTTTTTTTSGKPPKKSRTTRKSSTRKSAGRKSSSRKRSTRAKRARSARNR